MAGPDVSVAGGPPTALFLIHDLESGGAERVYLEYLRRVTAFRAIPVVIRPRGALAPELPADRPRYHLERFGGRGVGLDGDEAWIEAPPSANPQGAVSGAISLFAKARRLARIVRHERAVLVCTFLHKSHVIALLAKSLYDPSLRVILNIHEQPRQHIATHFGATGGRLMGAFYRWMLPRADGVVAVAQGIREELEADFGVPKGLVDVVANPIDIQALRARAAGPEPDDLPGGEGPLLVAVGRLEHIKGFDLLIEAVRQARMTMPLRLALIGDGTQRRALEKQVSSSGLDDCVSLPGYRAEPMPYIAAADLMVLPSRTEAWPTVVGEAMAVGTPVLATRCSPGVVEFLCGGSCGALTHAGSAEGLATSIQALVLRPEVLEGFAAAGLERAEQFSAQTILEQYERVLRSAMNAAPLAEA